MNRRVFLTGLGTVLTIPHAAAPQEAKKPLARIGYLAAVSAAADAPRADAFRQGLRDLGYIEGQNI
jgi:putative tryptophan/tyrosine transport system substrate-binding protein